MRTSRSHGSGLKAPSRWGPHGCFASMTSALAADFPWAYLTRPPVSEPVRGLQPAAPLRLVCQHSAGRGGRDERACRPGARSPALALVSANGQDRDTLPAFENGKETWASLRLTVFDGAFTAGCAQTDAACNRLRRRRALVASVSAPGRPKSQPRRVGQHREQQPCCHAVPDAFGDQRDDQADQCRNGYEGRRCPDVMRGARMAFHSAGSPSALARLG